MYSSILLGIFYSVTQKRGNLYLIQINILGLQEAVKQIRMNLSWYSEQDTKNEFLPVLNEIVMTLGDLEKNFWWNLLELKFSHEKSILKKSIR